MKLNFAVLTLSLFVISFPGWSGVYEVVNVPDNDTLNLREKPDPKSAKVTVKIPAGAKDILFHGESEQYKSSTWYKIRYGNATGWVNSRFLREQKPVKPELLETLLCRGTEPFWILKREGKKLQFSMYSDPEQTFQIADVKTSLNHGNQWRVSAKGESSSISVSFTDSRQCSDGMSDFIFRYDARISKGEEYLTGCCNKIGGQE